MRVGILERAENLERVAALECFDDAVNDLRELFQSWDNHFTRAGKSLIEKNIENDLTIILDCEFSRRGNRSKASSRSVDNNIAVSDNVSLMIVCIDAQQSQDLYRWNQESVFVNDIEFVESEKGAIPSLVRFYDVDNQIGDSGTGRLYYSIRYNSYKLCSQIANRKIERLRTLLNLFP